MQSEIKKYVVLNNFCSYNNDYYELETCKGRKQSKKNTKKEATRRAKTTSKKQKKNDLILNSRGQFLILDNKKIVNK